jgi:pro-kumamolisin-like protein/ASPM-SPD-2-Hydin domain-containing protein/centrosomal CEP192-like protein
MRNHSAQSATRMWTLPCVLVVALSVVATCPASAQVWFSNLASTSFKPYTPGAVKSGDAVMTAHYNPSQMLRLTLGLQPPHVAEEQEFLQQLQIKGKGGFHKFLSAEEWTKRFDPSVEDEQAVVDWATAQGLTITHRFPNRLIVDVEGTAATIEKAFNVTMNSYQLGTKTFFSNDRDPEIPSSLIGIIHSVGGLQNLQTMQPANKSIKEPAFPDYSPGPAVSRGQAEGKNGDGSMLPEGLKKKSASQSSPATGGPNYTTGAPYDPQDMYSTAGYSAYALYNRGHCCNPTGNAGVTPPQTSIAIATAGSQQVSDMAGFQSHYPYLAYHFQEYNIDGTPSCCDGEGTMDLEWSTAMANSFGALQNTAMVYMYDGVNSNFGTFNDIYNFMLTDGYARNFSTSWGWVDATLPGGDMDTADAIFSSMIGQGWTLTAASGDGGASYSCQDFDSVSFPASDPNVVAAGGATLYMSGGPPPTFDSIYAWSGGPDGCSTNDGGSTGGYSDYWTEPSYQSGLPSRGVPDIALNADWYNTPQYLYFEGGLGGNGGTSIVAPETVGFFAQENAYLLALGNICGSSGTDACSPMGALNPILYRVGYDGYDTHNPFYDITSGCNNNNVTTADGLGYYCAGAGWDAVTGWGAYNFLQLAWAINWNIVPGDTVPVVNFTGPATGVWYNSDQEVSWTITAPPANSYPSEGLAGFSQEWDADPGNPTSEPSPAYSGFPSSPYNSFYDGPQYTGASGCLDVTAAVCAYGGGGGQGWHTVNVRAWGNEGENGGDYTYGPIGYDTIPPVTTAALSGTKVSGTTYKSAVKVTLSASDPGSPTTGSGVAHTYYELNSGGWQTYSSPLTVGYTGNYTVYYYSTDNAGNAGSVVSTNFTIDPVLSFSSSSLAFGNEVIGTTSAGQVVTVTNISSSAVSISAKVSSGDFAISATTCGSSLAASAKCTITVTFGPTIAIALSGDVTVSYNGLGSPGRISLTGSGLAPLAAAPSSLTFGTVAVGSTSAAKTVTLTNDNPTTALSISFSASGDYTVGGSGGTPCGATLAGAKSCTLSVTFKPSQKGAIDGAVSVKDGAPLGPLLVGLSGTGTSSVASPLTFTPASLNFTNVVVGQTASTTVTVKNTSASSVKISSTSASGEYASSGCVTTLTSGASCTLTVTFTPSRRGTWEGSIAINDNTSVSPEVLNASGMAILPLNLTPTSLSFGGYTVGTTSSSQIVTVRNKLTTSMSLALAASGDFSATAGGSTPCGTSLAGGGSCTFVVTFSPTTTGAITGAATVTYAGRYSPQEVTLSGTGQ